MKIVIKGYITNEWSKRLFNHGQTLEIMGSLSGIPRNCIIRLQKDDEYCQPIEIKTEFTGDKPADNPGMENINYPNKRRY